MSTWKPLEGVHIVSLALNLPGPAALMRLCAMGARCSKVAWGDDPMLHYSSTAFEAMHDGVELHQINLKTPQGQAALDALLQTADVLLTSFRAQALVKLKLDEAALRMRHPHLSSVSIFGALGLGANEAGHDLTYQAQHGLLGDLQLPSTLMADMAGALCASEAVLSLVLGQARARADGKAWVGQHLQVGLSESAQFMAQPLTWGLTTPGTVLGGAHAGYRVYCAQDGRVALAALEPHFWAHWCQAVGWASEGDVMPSPTSAETAQRVADAMATQTCAHWAELAARHDIPLHVLPNAG